MKRREKPWQFLEQYRGKLFSGEWPTLAEMFSISAKRFPDRPCFTIYEPDRISLSYRESETLIGQVAQYLLSIGIKRR